MTPFQQQRLARKVDIRQRLIPVTLTLSFSLLLAALPASPLHPLLRHGSGLLIGLLIVGGVGFLVWRNHRDQQRILQLQAALQAYETQQALAALRAEELSVALHDLHSPISALKLSVELLQRVSCEDDKRHLARMEASLESAIALVQQIAHLHKGKTSAGFPPRQQLPRNTDGDYDTFGARADPG